MTCRFHYFNCYPPSSFLLLPRRPHIPPTMLYNTILLPADHQLSDPCQPRPSVYAEEHNLQFNSAMTNMFMRPLAACQSTVQTTDQTVIVNNIILPTKCIQSSGILCMKESNRGRREESPDTESILNDTAR